MPTPATPTPPADTIRRPRNRHIVATGVWGGAAAAAWIACIGSYLGVAAGEAADELAAVLLGLAVTTTVITGLLWTACLVIRTTAHNSGCVLAKATDVDDSLAQLAAEMEQLSARIERIDPMAIYTAVASDLLRQDGRP